MIGDLIAGAGVADEAFVFFAEAGATLVEVGGPVAMRETNDRTELGIGFFYLMSVTIKGLLENGVEGRKGVHEAKQGGVPAVAKGV